MDFIGFWNKLKNINTSFPGIFQSVLHLVSQYNVAFVFMCNDNLHLSDLYEKILTRNETFMIDSTIYRKVYLSQNQQMSYSHKHMTEVILAMIL